MKSVHKKEVLSRLMSEVPKVPELISEKDLEHLPEPVKKYIRFTGFVGKEKNFNVFIKANGQIRSNKNDGWIHFTSEQYNFLSSPLRAFYISAKKWGIPATGLHLYKNEIATMVIKIAGLFKVVDAKGSEMNRGETVTVFNDMCFMAPGCLISRDIQWETMNENQVKATFSNGKISVSALLTFDDDGKLVNFISYDRFETTDGKIYRNFPWETPVKQYSGFGSYYLPSKAEVIYKYPEGDFCYLVFNLENIKYNVTDIQKF